MNQKITSTIGKVVVQNEQTVLILCGIAMYSFREYETACPGRVVNIGIMEQTAVGMAAGMSTNGIIPFVYTWAPFLVERAYEQLKLDFGCQKLEGNFIGVGGSYDLTAFGDSHYCPADVTILNQIRNMQIVVPGTEEEFQMLLGQAYDNGFPTYYRIGAQRNVKSYEVVFGRAEIIKRGTKATIIVVGPILDSVSRVAEDYDVTLLYYTTVSPFDKETFLENFVGDRVMICEPYHNGAILEAVMRELPGRFIKMAQVGLNKDMVCEFGTYQENLSNFRLREEDIRMQLEKLLE